MQVGIFSATLPPDALEITRKFMNKPVSIASALASGCTLAPILMLPFLVSTLYAPLQ